MIKIIKWLGIVLGALIGVVLLVGLALYPFGSEKLTRSFPDIPVERLNIPTDPEAVAHGKHISIVWRCTKCHAANLSGSLLADDPFLGTIPASNLTSGMGGIAKSYTDTDWVRAIRHGVKPDGRVEVRWYDYYSTMSDRDLGDLIAYLKQIPPVDADYPSMRLGPIVTIAPAIGLLTPGADLIDHDAPRPADPAPGATTEYGRYLFALCTGCHGTNLPSKLEKWKQDDFIRTVRTGILPDGKQISPTKAHQANGEMNDVELDALWLYMQSLTRQARRQ